MIGFGFEAVADEQLYRFKSNPENAGKVFSGGLWAWSRHPNYFGECLVWWGFFFVTASTPFSFWTIISPVLITLVLLKMTGIPLTEETLLRKKPEYSDYIRRTRPFVPWFPKNR
jgi:steroid 5-alpha reductase family enzyme